MKLALRLRHFLVQLPLVPMLAKLIDRLLGNRHLLVFLQGQA
jgi:hypothetical protein